jgi:hypothetical protein
MHTANGTKVLRGIAALLALMAVAASCGVDETGSQPNGATQTTAGDLLSNVPYLNGAPKAKSNTAGDAVVFKGKAYFAYITPQSNVGIISESNLGSNGQTPTTFALPGATFGGPALMTVGNVLYVFYISGSWLVMQRSADGANWTNQTFLAQPSYNTWTTPPVAVAWDGAVRIFIGQGGAGWPNMITQYTVSGVTASGPSFVPATGQTMTTNNRPAATVWNNTLYLAFADSTYSNQIGMMRYTDARGWSTETLTGKTGIPGLFPTAAAGLELVYRANDAHIYRAYSQDGTSFGASIEDTASTTNHAPIPFSNLGTSSNWVFYVGVDTELFTVIE